MGSMNAAPGEPWYRDGLRFQCTQCGNCCTGDPGVVWPYNLHAQACGSQTGSTAVYVPLVEHV